MEISSFLPSLFLQRLFCNKRRGSETEGSFLELSAHGLEDCRTGEKCSLVVKLRRSQVRGTVHRETCMIIHIVLDLPKAEL